MNSIKVIDFEISELQFMKKHPKRLYYRGNPKLLQRKKVSIVGSRRPSVYAKEFTYYLAKELAKRGVVIVSGAAMGIDAIAHMGAGAKNTIAVFGNGLEIIYPKVNKNLIEAIYKEGLALSFFEPNFKATNWSFVARNELVVALGECLIVTEANSNSGSMRSVEFALAQGKEIFVLPHRLNESKGTNELLAKGLAKAIFDIEQFLNHFGKINETIDEFSLFMQKNPTLDEAIAKFGTKVYEAELEGKIAISNGKCYLLI